ncbi:MAG: succinylglutamate desuccinylase/aspartoacylase family protein [Acidobacteriota bacterium]
MTASRRSSWGAFKIGGTKVAPGKRVRVPLPVARLFTGTDLDLTVVVLRGARPGPRVWINAAIHGDELNGIRIIRDVVRSIDPKRLSGTILAVPVVNLYGLIHSSRYLPDRRDLNRSFPGSRRGSLASRLARLFVDRVVEGSDVGIDLHTAGPGRTNLPHIRTNQDDPESWRLALAFGAPLVYRAGPPRGSLRALAAKRGVPILVYEAGEPLRFNRFAIDAGVAGVLRVLRTLEMWPSEVAEASPSVVGTETRWIRAKRSGVFNTDLDLGARVESGQEVGVITDPFPTRGTVLRAPTSGLVMGLTVNPMVHQGDALIHVAQTAEDAAPDDGASSR